MAVKMIVILGCVAAFAGVSSAKAILGQRAFMGNGMQPDVVARTLSNVQNEWKAQVAIAAECDTTSKLPGSPIVNCKDAHQSFDKSCRTIVGAIVQGSGGDKAVTNEYMDDVCNQQSMSGWHQLHCHGLTVAVFNSMSADKYRNRVAFNSTQVCTNLWSQLLDERVKEVAKDNADREAAEKKAAEEEKRELEAHEKEAEAKAKAEAERKAKAEADRVKQEAAAKAAEAKAKAAEAAAKAQQKKAEAEAAREAAKQKAAEAEAEQKRVAAAAEAKRVAAEDAEKARLAAAKKSEEAAAPKPVAVEPKPVAAAAAPVAKPAAEKLVAPKAVAAKASKFLVAAAAPSPAKAGAPAGAPGAPAGLSNEAILKGKMDLKAAEQGFTGKGVKHTDGKTSAADWQNEYATK